MKLVEGMKQMKVDNWGAYLLQKLQVFFNKTDHCDLTLQFERNVQLKVHRLVINACTGYFTFLEQTCGVHGDVLIMPADLQADVILPIINFMYTGMLEFHMSILEKLYKAAALMNITVLTKLLDTFKNPVQQQQQLQRTKTQKTNKKTPSSPLTHHQYSGTNSSIKKMPSKLDSDLPTPLPGRKLPIWKRKTVPNMQNSSFVELRKTQSENLLVYDSTPKPTRFEWPEEELSSLSLFESSFDDISYTSKPLLTKEHEPKPSTSSERSKDFLGDKVVLISSPDDLAKEPRRRSNLTEFNIDENSSDTGGSIITSFESHKRKLDDNRNAPTSAKKVRFNINEKENNQNNKPKLNITHVGKASSPDLSHSKIISEVLKRYPHIVKKNKNIKLKILAKNSNSPITSPEKTTGGTLKNVSSTVKVLSIQDEKHDIQIKSSSPSSSGKKEDGPWSCHKCSTTSEPCEFVLYYLYRKHMTDVHREKFDPHLCKYCGLMCSRDNLLMYHQYTKHGMKPPSQYDFPKCPQCPFIALTEQLLAKHRANHSKSDLQCSNCKVAFNNLSNLTAHMQITGHNGKLIRTNSFDCQYCTKKFQNGASLFSHIKAQHRDEARRDGVISLDEDDTFEDLEEEDMEVLYEEQQMEQQQQQTELKRLAEEEEVTQQQQEQLQSFSSTNNNNDKKGKIKILSNVKVDGKQNHVVVTSSQQQLQPSTISLQSHGSSEAEALTNVASGIATSLGLVDIVVLDDNQQYILHSNDQQHHLTTASASHHHHDSSQSQSEFIIPELSDAHQTTFCTTTTTTSGHQTAPTIVDQTTTMLNNSDIASTDELVMVLTDHDYGDETHETVSADSSNIVVLYSHPAVGDEGGQIITTTQGNIMINSETGVFELRGTGDGNETFVPITTGNSVLIDNGPNPPPAIATAITTATTTTSSQIESIEMIQREIESHGKQVCLDDDDDDKMETEEVHTSNDQQETALLVHKIIEATVEEEEEEHEEMNTTTDVQEEKPQEEQTGGQHIEEVVYAKETEDDHANESLSDAPMLTQQECFSSPQREDHQQQLEGKEQIATNDDQNDQLTQEQQQQENSDVEKRDEEESDTTVKNGEEEANNQQNHEEYETKVTTEERRKQEEKSVEEKRKDEYHEVVFQGEETNEVLIEVEVEEERHVYEEENSAQKGPEDVPVGDSEGSGKRVEVENNKEEKSNNVDLESEVSQTYSENQEKKEESSKSSAKIILDEWEDTDSQQSENNVEKKNKSSTEVHKLIDDWEDEDDEDGGKTNT